MDGEIKNSDKKTFKKLFKLLIIFYRCFNLTLGCSYLRYAIDFLDTKIERADGFSSGKC